MPKAVARSADAAVRMIRRDDGTLILENALDLPAISGTIPQRLAKWANEKPDAPYLTQGDSTLTYGEAEKMRRNYAARLLATHRDSPQPLMIIAENSIQHALIVLAATSVNIPVAVVSPSYVAVPAEPWGKFRRVFEQIEPYLIIADRPELVKNALGKDQQAEIKPMRDLTWLQQSPAAPEIEVDAAQESVTLDTVSKLLFTSGSTSHPKAVPNTQRMMVSNMLALEKIWPFLAERAPISVDWLPWNHTFGGNCCFHITLWFGGHSIIDNGRPSLDAIEDSVNLLRQHEPSLFYNVPAGFEMLATYLEEDEGFATRFFDGLDFLFNAGAPLPDAIRKRYEDLAIKATGQTPNFVGAWGATETAPFSTALYFNQTFASNIGLPVPGTQLKLIPNENRYEIRVKGPNVMRGYWGDDAGTEAAFDQEGFYRIGDAAKFADPENPAAGLLFDGRVAENFKLASGTWVNVGQLRLNVISATEKLVSDAVIAGEGRKAIGVLLFPNEKACKDYLRQQQIPLAESETAGSHPAVRERIEELIAALNARQMGSSTRIRYFEIMSEPPSLPEGEITEKGYINQRRVLTRRAADVAKLYPLEPA